MKLKLTNKEEFLVSMTQYLSNYYLPQKVNKILDDFVWDNDY